MRINKGLRFMLIAALFAAFNLSGCILKQASDFDVPAYEFPIVKDEEIQESTISIMACGDQLYHGNITNSAKTGDGYDFTYIFSEVAPLLQSADIAIGDFEGSVNPDLPIASFPRFNAPEQAIANNKEAGFDVISLAHNHTLDTGLDGALYTAQKFKEQGIDICGFRENKDDDNILIKEVEGIKVAIVGFTYGYNYEDGKLSSQERADHLEYLNATHIKETLERAEEMADITVVLPHAGIEYTLTPTQSHKKLYHDMIDWGADVVFGGHPHVCQPTETIEKDGEKKFILYSMGNLFSGMRQEYLHTAQNYVPGNDKWVERGVIMQVDVTKNNNATKITKIIPHPVYIALDNNSKFKVLLTENYVLDKNISDNFNDTQKNKAKSTYSEMLDLLRVDEGLLHKPA